MSSTLNQLQERIQHLLWEPDVRLLDTPRRYLVRTLRLVYVVVRDLMSGDLTLRAMSLVYTTLLSLVPLLAVSFSVLKAFGVHHQIEPMLANFLLPIGPKGEELAENIIAFVENVRVGLLGSVGLGLLVYTAISLVQKIEQAFNFVWRVETHRTLAQRFGNYLSVILIGPVLVFVAQGLTFSLKNTDLVQKLIAVEPFGTLMFVVGKVAPYVFVFMAFTLIYAIVPNTRVNTRAAMVGGLVAGALWQTSGWAFTAFIASSSRYAAIYSSFAVVILFLIWLYLNWLILLLGSQVAFYVQCPHYVTMKPSRIILSNRIRERLAVSIMFLIGYSHYHNRPPWTVIGLAKRLDVPYEPASRVMSFLGEAGFVRSTSDDPPAYLPARDIETIEVRELLAAVGRAGEGRFLQDKSLPRLAPVDGILIRARAGTDGAVAGTSVRDLVLEQTEPLSQAKATAPATES